MSLNKVDVRDGRLTLHGDYVVHHQDSIEFSLEGDKLPQDMKKTLKGDVFVTNTRLVFTNSGANGYRSFSMDFDHIRNTEIKQPIFGSNYLKGYIIAEPNGGWEGSANFHIYFPKGGAIDFAEKFQRAVKDCVRNRQRGIPPGVVPQPNMQPTGIYPPMGGLPQMNGPPMQMGMPPNGPPPPMANGQYYPPPQQSLYVYQGTGGGPPNAGQQPLYQHPSGQAPPPYNPNPSASYNGDPNQSSADAKAHEAYMSGNTAYVPNEAPPPYNPNYAERKDQ